MHAVLAGQLRGRQLTPQRLYRNLGLELSRITLPLAHHGSAGLFNAQYIMRIARIALMPPKAIRWRPSETLWMPLKRRILAANERRRAKMPELQRIRLASSAKLPSRT